MKLLFRMSHSLLGPRHLPTHAVCGMLSMVVVAAAAEQKRNYDLPRGEAATMLARFAEQSGRPVLFAMDKVRGTRTNVVVGEFSPAEALDRLLAGTELIATFDRATGDIVVSRRPPPAPSGGQGSAAPAVPPPGPSKAAQPKALESPPVKKRTVLSIVAAWLAAGTALDAQPPATPPKDEAIVLSPFVVDATTDSGYTATNTEAGSRLNAKLLDTPAPISIMTKELLSDLAITNLQDAIEFGVNTEATRSQDDNQGQTTAYTVRGIRSTQTARNFFIAGGRLDTYIIDRTTVSRGPNSILFGNADPSGIINISTKQAMFRGVREISTRIDDNGSWRVSGDFNQVLVPKRVALRVNLLKDRYYGPMEPDYRNDNAYHLASTVRLVDSENYKLTARGEYEHSSMGRVLARVSNVVSNAVTPWLTAGSPALRVAGGAGSAATRPVGVSNLSSTSRLVAIIQGGPLSVADWRNMGVGSSTSPTVPIMAESIWPLYTNPQGTEGGRNGGQFSNRTAYLEQQFGRNLYLSLSYNRFESRNEWWKGLGGSQGLLQVDPNAVLPNGLTNPNFGRYYFESNVMYETDPTEAEAGRASLAYEYDFEREKTGWLRVLGLQRLAASYETLTNYKFSQQWREVNTTPLAGYSTQLSNAANFIYRRWYLDRASGVLTVGDVDTPIHQDGVNSAMMPTVLPNSNRADQKSFFVSNQAYWWKRRFVTTVGIRRDAVRGYSMDPRILPNAVGVYPLVGKDTIDSALAYETTTNTKSTGVVLHFGMGLSVFANRSDNFLAGAVRNDVDGALIPLPSGESRDFGLKFHTKDNRISGTFSRYDSSKKGEYITASYTTQYMAIWDALNEPSQSVRRPGGGKGGWNDTQNYKASGYELELALKPTPAWSVLLNGNTGDAVKSDVLPGSARYVAKYIDLWRASGNLMTSTNLTINQNLDNLILPYIAQQQAQNGTSSLLRRRWGGNFVTAYRFDSGLLRGITAGGSGQFRDRPIIGYPITADGRAIVGSPYYGNRNFTAGAFLRYETKLRAKQLRWSVQLNVQNLFDNTELQKSSKTAEGIVNKVTVLEPRRFVLSNTIGF